MFHLESKKWKTYVLGIFFRGIFFTSKVCLVRLSTIQLPSDFGYETCIFYADGTSDVLEHYETKAAAIEGHRDHTIAHGLKYSKYTL